VLSVSDSYLSDLVRLGGVKLHNQLAIDVSRRLFFPVSLYVFDVHVGINPDDTAGLYT
jgi:hypothetical protein